MTQVVSGTLTTQYAYNGDGARVAKTVADATTQYLVDLMATLPVVISDTEAIYLYGLDIIAQQQAGVPMYYMHDGLGSVRQLTDPTGEVVEAYAYDPFGVPLSAGSVPNPYRFTGEAWDAEVELLYLRARYYQPATGRFVTRDPWPGDRLRPGTLNFYVYVGNNPANWADPSGLQEAYRVTPGTSQQGPPTPGSAPTPQEPQGRPQPSPAPTPGPQGGFTSTPWDIQTALVQELASVYGIYAQRVYKYG